MTFILLTLYSK